MFAQEVRRALAQLERANLAILDLHLSAAEQQSLGRIAIQRNLPQFDSYGTTDARLVPKLERYFAQMGKNDAETIQKLSALVQRLADDLRSALGAHAAWVMVRVSLPSPVFDMPRWHSDGQYFPSQNRVYKFVTTLKGPHTLFGGTLQDRETTGTVVPTVRLIDGQGALYLVGTEDAAIHSEPPLSQPRIFISILPGSEEQIIAWQQRRQ